MPENPPIIEIQMGPQGRVVIPASLRQAWQIKTGETLMAHLEDDRLILEKPAHILERAKSRFAALAGLPSLADELIAERHREAIQEDAP